MLLTERLLLLKHRSSLGFRAQRADVMGHRAVPVCSSTAENYRASRRRHLLTCIRCQDKQRIASVCGHQTSSSFLQTNTATMSIICSSFCVIKIISLQVAEKRNSVKRKEWNLFLSFYKWQPFTTAVVRC